MLLISHKVSGCIKRVMARLHGVPLTPECNAVRAVLSGVVPPTAQTAQSQSAVIETLKGVLGGEEEAVKRVYGDTEAHNILWLQWQLACYLDPILDSSSLPPDRPMVTFLRLTPPLHHLHRAHTLTSVTSAQQWR